MVQYRRKRVVYVEPQSGRLTNIKRVHEYSVWVSTVLPGRAVDLHIFMELARTSLNRYTVYVAVFVKCFGHKPSVQRRHSLSAEFRLPSLNTPFPHRPHIRVHEKNSINPWQRFCSSNRSRGMNPLQSDTKTPALYLHPADEHFRLSVYQEQSAHTNNQGHPIFHWQVVAHVEYCGIISERRSVPTQLQTNSSRRTTI